MPDTGKDLEKLERSYIAGGAWNGTITLEINFGFS